MDYTQFADNLCVCVSGAIPVIPVIPVVVIPVIPVTPVILVTYELARGVVSFVAGAHFQPYMSVPTGPTWGGAGPVSRVSRDSLILTLYHGRDRSAGGRTRSVQPVCRATMRVIGWTRRTMGATQHAGWGGTLMYGWK